MSLPQRPKLLSSDSSSAAANLASRQERVRALKEQVAWVSLGESGSGEPDGWVASGCPALDRRLTAGTGFRRGSLVEWFCTGPGSGAGTLALLVARQAWPRNGTLVVVDGAGQFYPPAAAACGLDLRRLVVIRPQGFRDTLWAWDQALRCTAVKAVWGRLEAIDDRWFRRFQLAAEQSGCLGLLLRPAKYRGDPSWSEVQLAVSPREGEAPAEPQQATEAPAEPQQATEAPAEPQQATEAAVERGRCLRVELVRCRRSLSPGWSPGGEHAVVNLKLEEHHGHLQVIEASRHETPALHLVSELADPAFGRCAPELRRRAIVLFGRDPRRGARVVACSRVARQQGIRIGMPLPEATVLLEHLHAATPHSAPVHRIRSGRALLRSDDQLAQLGIWPHCPAVDRQALEQLVTWGEAFSPRVGLDEQPTPAGLLMDLTGVTARQGGEDKLAQHLQAQLQQRGYWGQLGLADTLGAAWALAHFGHAASSAEGAVSAAPGGTGQPPRAAAPRRGIYIARPGQTRQHLAPLPVAALRLSDTALEWLRELGVEYIEQLGDLPRAGVSTRLGSEVLQRLDQAQGLCDETYSAHQPSLSFVAQWQAEHPTDRDEAIERVVEHLSHHLAQLLCSQQQGALQLRCCLYCEPRVMRNASDDAATVTKLTPVELDVNLFQPTPQADYLWQLLRMQLESIRLPGPVASIELQATATAPLGQRQPQLWETDSTVADGQQLANLIDRLSNRLGPHVVCAARLRAGALPETAYALIPLAGPEASLARLNAGPPRTPPAPDHRPLQLIHPPLPLQMLSQSPQGAPLRFVASDASQQVLHCWGPERIETAWWQGPSVRRDYYRVHCVAGARFWLFCNLVDQGWFLHGEFI